MLYTALDMPSTRTQVYLTAEQRARVEARMRRERKSLAQVVRDALDAYLSDDEGFDRVVNDTFGALPDLEVPSRDEWDRGF